MAASLRLAKVRRIAQTGRVYLDFSDGVQIEFPSPAEARAWASDIDLDDEATRTLLRRLLVRWWMHRDPASATAATVEGKTITLDLSLATPLVVS